MDSCRMSSRNWAGMMRAAQRTLGPLEEGGRSGPSPVRQGSGASVAPAPRTWAGDGLRGPTTVPKTPTSAVRWSTDRVGRGTTPAPHPGQPLPGPWPVSARTLRSTHEPKAPKLDWHQGITAIMLRCMRTTLSLDDDVAARIKQLRRALDKPLKEVVNEALRRGLVGMHEPRPPAPYCTQPVDLGRCRLPNVDDVASALAAAEGEGYR